LDFNITMVAPKTASMESLSHCPCLQPARASHVPRHISLNLFNS